MVLCSLLTGRLLLVVWMGNKSAAAEKVVVGKFLGEDILDKETFVEEGRIIQESNIQTL